MRADLPALFPLGMLALCLLLTALSSGKCEEGAADPPPPAVPLVLENAEVRITVDGRTGAVLGITNVQTGAECLAPRSEHAPPFIVDMYSANQAIYIRDPFERQSGGYSLYNPSAPKTPGDLTHARTAVEGGVQVTLEKTVTGDRLVCVSRLPGGVVVTYSITLRGDSPLTEWRVRVENQGGEAPDQDKRVYRVAFPVLEGVRIGPNHESNFLARPYAQGELIPDPASYDFLRPKRTTPTFVLSYPGWASMSWMDQYGSDGGLYLASYDLAFQQMDLESWPNRAAGTMTLGMRTLAFLEPGEEWESQAFAVGVHEGDWHWAADRYREWAHKYHKAYTGPQWPRLEADGWFGTGLATNRYADYLTMYDDARWLGLDYLQIWSEMLENVGPDKSRKSYYCFLWPDPDRGGEAELTRTVRAIRAQGGHIGFYHNLWTWDADLAKGMEQWKDELPPNVHVPEWWGEARTWASVFPDGSRIAGNWADPPGTRYSGMCPAAEGYQDYILHWVVDKYIKEYGVDAWYFDSMPVTMFSASRICFSDEHGHRQPHGVSEGFLGLLTRLNAAARPYVNPAVTSETVCDALMQYNSHALGLEYLEGISRYVKPEIYAYTWPEHAIYSGTCNGAGNGLKYYWPDVGDQPRREDTMNHVFLMGSRFDILSHVPLNREDPFMQHLRKLIALRGKVKREIYGADFRDEIGLGPLPERVYAKLFRRTDGSSMAINLVDRRVVRKGPLTLTLDLRPHDFLAPGEAVLYDLDGQETKLTSALADGVLTLQLPELQGEVGTVVIRRQ